MTDRKEPAGDRSARATANRRQFERVDCRTPARVWLLNEFNAIGQDWDCVVVDLSRGGVRIISKRMVYAGQTVLVEVRPKGSAPKRLGGVVRACTYREGEGYCLGVQFAPLPAGDEIEAWLRAAA